MSSVVATAQASSVAPDVERGATTAPVAFASRLSVWCNRLIEAGWLAAIIVVPLFFNIYSSRVFEPDKLTTLRSIALVMAMAWVVKWLEEFRNPNRDRSVTWRTPLVLPTLIIIVVYMISTALSIAPRTSLLGSYQRLQGTYTTFAYIVVFLMILQGMRRRAQLDRLITLIIIISLPVAIYGLLQRLQLDPLPWGGDTVERVAGNMGNSIFIAAYLVMAFFITFYRIADSFASILQNEQPRWSDVVRAACYILVALFNAIVVLILAGSRGPQLGWLGGVLFVALLLVQLVRRRQTRLRLTIGLIGLGIAGLAFLYFINVTRNDPSYEWLRQFPLFRRLGTVLTTQEGTNAVRVLIWEGAANLVAPHDPITRPDGTPDAFNAIRPLIGYGPESMYVAYNRFYPPALANFEARNASPDRSHNETWDALVITGVFGLLAYMFLFGSVLYYGFRWIGLIASRFEAQLFVVMWIAGAALFGLGAVVAGHRELFGIAIGAGVVFGLTVFLFVSAIINARRGDDEALPVQLSLRDQLLLIAIVSTIIAHFVEIHTGIAVAATRTYFWTLIGVMVVVGAGLLRSDMPEVMDGKSEAEAGAVKPAASTSAGLGDGRQAAGGTRRQRRAAQQRAAAARRTAAPARRGFILPSWFGTVAAYGLFLGLILGIMAFDFTNNIERSTAAGQVFINAMTRVKGQPSFGVLTMFLITLIVGLAVILAELRSGGVLRDNEHTVAAGALIASLAMFVWVAFGTFIAGRLVAFFTSPQNSVSGVLSIADQLAAFPAYVYLLIAAVMIGSAFLLRSEEPTLPAKGASYAGLTGLFVGAIAVPIAVAYSNLQPIAADIVYKQASPWDQDGSRELVQGTGIQGWDLAIEHYRRSIQLAPNEDFYYLWLGRALLEKAKTTPNPSQAKTIPEDAPFTHIIGDEPENWNRPYGSDALPSASLSRQDLLTAARIILEEARVINPFNTDHSANLARMWQQSGDIVRAELDMERARPNPDPARIAELVADAQRRYENASKEYATATRLSPNNAQLWNEWASLYLSRLGSLEEAKVRLDRSLALDKKFSQTYLLRAAWHVEKARTLDRQTNQAEWRAELERAREELNQAVAVDPNSLQAYQELARIALDLGDTQAAINALQAMLVRNPNDWNTLKNLAVLYSDTRQITLAVEYARRALERAPADQQLMLSSFIQQLGSP
ncbi:MAG: O-antigen ligase family protein [Anaerolineae bacterium]|nr:O-antigen ligase family protein [Candidatus Roseilinea sp.]MDW8450624.1 O-antigen ligase family protein [Anaerolineae bacterium]